MPGSTGNSASKPWLPATQALQVVVTVEDDAANFAAAATAAAAAVEGVAGVTAAPAVDAEEAAAAVIATQEATPVLADAQEAATALAVNEESAAALASAAQEGASREPATLSHSIAGSIATATSVNATEVVLDADQVLAATQDIALQPVLSTSELIREDMVDDAHPASASLHSEPAAGTKADSAAMESVLGVAPALQTAVDTAAAIPAVSKEPLESQTTVAALRKFYEAQASSLWAQRNACIVLSYCSCVILARGYQLSQTLHRATHFVHCDDRMLTVQ